LTNNPSLKETEEEGLPVSCSHPRKTDEIILIAFCVFMWASQRKDMKTSYAAYR
jgi:hypothetical protein